MSVRGGLASNHSSLASGHLSWEGDLWHVSTYVHMSDMCIINPVNAMTGLHKKKPNIIMILNNDVIECVCLWVRECVHTRLIRSSGSFFPSRQGKHLTTNAAA